MGAWRRCGSRREQSADVAVARRLVGKRERALAQDLAACFEQRSERSARHCRPERYPGHTCLGELSHGQIGAGKNVDPTVDGTGHGGDRFDVRQPRCLHHLCPGVGEPLQTIDGVRHVVDAMKQVFGTGGEHESGATACFYSSLNSCD